MPDLEALNAVAAADIEAVNGVAKANIQAINGVTVVSGQTATRWVAAFDGAGNETYLGYAAHSDRTDWTGTSIDDGASPNILWLAYGKDGSGNALWVITTDIGNMEIAHDGNNDVTDGSAWTSLTNDSEGNDLEKCHTVAWGNDVWVAAGVTGGSAEVYRSTDGASWVRTDLSGVSGIGSGQIYGLASDSAGNWMFGQGAKVFISTNNASAWAELGSYTGTAVADVGFTNGTWVVLGAANPGNVNTVSAAAFATEAGGGSAATWGEQDVNGAGTSNTGTINVGQAGSTRTRMACGAGVVIVAHVTNTMAFDVNGATIAVRASGKIAVANKATAGGDTVIEGDINTVATDGNGTWLVGSNGDGTTGGDIAESTDNGATWDPIVENFNYSGGSGGTYRKFEAIRANVYLPV